MAQQIAHAIGSPFGNAATKPPRRSVWYRIPAGPTFPGPWMTTSRWTVEDLELEGFEVRKEG